MSNKKIIEADIDEFLEENSDLMDDLAKQEEAEKFLDKAYEDNKDCFADAVLDLIVQVKKLKKGDE